MRIPQWLARVLRFIAPVILADVVLLAIVALVCWLGGWRTLREYGDGLILAASVVLLIGLSGVFGGWGLTRSFLYQQSESAGAEAIGGRVRQELAGEKQNFRFLIEMTVVAAVAFTAAAILHSLVR